MVVPTGYDPGGTDSVARIEDLATIPQGLPVPQLTDFGLISIARFWCARGCRHRSRARCRCRRGRAESGRLAVQPNQDFIAQGVGNAASASSPSWPGGRGFPSVRLVERDGRREIAMGRGLVRNLDGDISSCSPGSSGNVRCPTLAAMRHLRRHRLDPTRRARDDPPDGTDLTDRRRHHVLATSRSR